MAAFSFQSLDQPLLTCFGTFDASTVIYENSNKAGFSNNDPFLSSKCGDGSSISIVESYYKGECGEQVAQKKVEKMEKKKRGRNNGDGSSLISSSQSMDGIEVKSKRHKKSPSVKTEDKEKKFKKTNDKKAENKISEEAPTEYIRVRARRGQATDSHSLAERVRREKIRGKMKILQELVPGCDKVTGKALMLDEIINYVQSLQNQVEFLSMKSASLDPMFFDFGMECENVNMTHEFEEIQRLNADPLIISDTFTDLATPTNIYSHIDHATSSLLFDPQIHRPHNIAQDDGQALWDVILNDQGQKLNNEFGFISNNLCSFY